MKYQFKTFSLLIVAVLFLQLSLNAQKSMLKVENYELDNGLTVILNEDHTKQKVFGVVAVKAGAKDDPADATGMAHYQEHMLFKGTQELGTVNWEEEKKYIDEIFSLYDELGQTEDEEKRAEIQKKINEASLKANEYAIPNELSNIIKAMGGTSLNAGTGWDQTLYYNAFPPGEIERWLDLYSHRFMNPVFRGFQAELEVVYEEKNLYNDRFQTQLIEAFNRNFYKNHPYGQQTIIGTADDLKNPSLTKMYQFFKTWYVPNNMALVITGDFDTEKIKPIIAEKFGRLETAEIPERKVYEEAAFEGREFFEDRLSPIKMGILGFRTVPSGHPDETTLNMANKILSNRNQTGLLDKLAIENELLGAFAFPMIQNDHGGTLFMFIPKIMGQSLEDGEQLVLEKIEMLKKGDFSDKHFEAVKQDTYTDFVRGLESLERKATLFASVYMRGQDVDDYLNQPEKIKAVSKQDIIDVANKYYGDNYLAFHSKMGSPDKEKIEKPGYEPLITNTNKKSEFAKRFEEIPVLTTDIKYIDFEKDLASAEAKNGTPVYIAENTINDIFSLEYKIAHGELKEPLLKYTAQLMSLAGTEDKDVNQIKSEFAALGSSYSVSVNDDYLSIRLNGIEENLEASLKLLNELLTKTQIEQEKIQTVVEGEQSNRKMEKSEPDNVASALFEYIKYKNESDYINRLTIKEIKKLETVSLVEKLNEALGYEAEVFFAGKTDKKDFVKLVNNYLAFSEAPKASDAPTEQKVEAYTENTVFLVDKPKALQSKIFFLINGKPYDLEEKPAIEAFNQYFGGGFSGLVLQEIREYRSMAYSAAAFYSAPAKEGFNTMFYGYIGTQADKTVNAVEIFNDLVRDMPQKTERTEMIAHYLKQSALTATPSFRQLAQQVNRWQTEGYKEDPRKMKSEFYELLTFDDILKFYKENIQDKPMVIAIVGDKDMMDVEKLSEFGTIKEINEKDLFHD